MANKRFTVILVWHDQTNSLYVSAANVTAAIVAARDSVGRPGGAVPPRKCYVYDGWLKEAKP